MLINESVVHGEAAPLYWDGGEANHVQFLETWLAEERAYKHTKS